MNKMKKMAFGCWAVALAALAILILAGCAPMTPPPLVTDADGRVHSAPMSQYEKDKADCIYEAEKYGGDNIFRYADVLRACLRTRGWQ
jgi:hypothetical protein